MHDELICALVIGHSGLHLDSIVSKAKLSKTEAAHNIQVVNLVKDVVVTPIVKSLNRPSEEVHLYGELDGSRGVNQADVLMGREDIVRILLEVSHRHELGSKDLLQSFEWVLSLLSQVFVVVDWLENGVSQE